jgi:hypothetical protein
LITAGRQLFLHWLCYSDEATTSTTSSTTTTASSDDNGDEPQLSEALTLSSDTTPASSSTTAGSGSSGVFSHARVGPCTIPGASLLLDFVSESEAKAFITYAARPK